MSGLLKSLLLVTVVSLLAGAEAQPAYGAEGTKVAIRTDPESIDKGRTIFNSKCFFCHDAESTKKKVGPGLKGVLKNPSLPVSGRPATAENIAKQLKTPFKEMPSFSYLSEEDVLNIIAFLNTL